MAPLRQPVPADAAWRAATRSTRSDFPSADGRRATILRAVADVVAERGMAGARVKLVLSRAEASSRTFYRLFGGLEDAVLALLEDTSEEICSLAAQALEERGPWVDRMREALVAVLSFFDADPSRAQVCLVASLAGSPALLRERQRLVDNFRAVVTRRIEAEVPEPSALAAESGLAAVLGLVHERVIVAERGALVELVGPLMGTLVAPFADRTVVAREIERGNARVRELGAGRARRPHRTSETSVVPRPALPAVIGNPSARRARQCLRFLAGHPNASNREIAGGIGVRQKSQISALLARLRDEGLTVRRSEGVGKPNAWTLTARGEEIARLLAAQEASISGDVPPQG